MTSPALVDLSLRAWTPVFSSLRQVLGDPLFLRLHPDWEAGQAEAVRASCTSSELDVYDAVLDDQPVGFVALALNAYRERMGAIEIIGLDPDHQRKGVGSALTEHALDVMAREGWTSPWWRPVATQVMRLRAGRTKQRASRCCR